MCQCMTHPLGCFSAPSFSKMTEARTTNMAPLERSGRDIPVDTSLCVFTLPVVEKIGLDIRPRVGYTLRGRLPWITCRAR